MHRSTTPTRVEEVVLGGRGVQGLRSGVGAADPRRVHGRARPSPATRDWTRLSRGPGIAAGARKCDVHASRAPPRPGARAASHPSRFGRREPYPSQPAGASGGGPRRAPGVDGGVSPPSPTCVKPRGYRLRGLDDLHLSPRGPRPVTPTRGPGAERNPSPPRKESAGLELSRAVLPTRTLSEMSLCPFQRTPRAPVGGCQVAMSLWSRLYCTESLNRSLRTSRPDFRGPITARSQWSSVTGSSTPLASSE